MARKKSNDDIPEDEMLLARAIAAAEDRGLEFCIGQRFYPNSMDPNGATACCAMGALQLGGCLDNGTPKGLMDVWRGNDSASDGLWYGDYDHGESLGWAFRCAMTQEEP